MSLELAIALGATLAAGVIRTSIGVGAGIFLTASLSLIFDPKVALAVMAFLQIAFGISALGHYWKRWDATLVPILTICALAGVFVGTYLVSTLPIDWIRRVLGAALALIAVTEIFRIRGETSQNTKGSRVAVGAIVIGFVSGIAGAMFNASGAVIATYLRKIHVPHEVFLGTLSAVIFGHDILRLIIYWQFELVDHSTFITSLIFVPFAFAGGWLGAQVRHRISERLLAHTVLWIIIILGAILLLK